MSTLVHQTLGRQRIREICREHGLTPEDEEIIDDILERWEHLIGQTEKKVAIAVEKTKNNPRHEQIVKAMLRINAEFAIKRHGY